MSKESENQPIALFIGELVCESEEVGSKDGRAEVAKEEAARDQLVRHLRFSHLGKNNHDMFDRPS